MRICHLFFCNRFAFRFPGYVLFFVFAPFCCNPDRLMIESAYRNAGGLPPARITIGEVHTMKRNAALAARCILFLSLLYFLIDRNGIAGLIDFLQFTEVVLTSVLLSLAIRAFHKRGLSYLMEWTALSAGILWTVIQLFLMQNRYGALEGMMLPVSMLSFWYGLMLSIGNSLLIRHHLKQKERERDVYE